MSTVADVMVAGSLRAPGGSAFNSGSNLEDVVSNSDLGLSQDQGDLFPRRKRRSRGSSRALVWVPDHQAKFEQGLADISVAGGAIVGALFVFLSWGPFWLGCFLGFFLVWALLSFWLWLN